MFPLTLFQPPSTSELILQILTLITTSQAKEILLIYALRAFSTTENIIRVFLFVVIGLMSASSTNDNCNKSQYYLNAHYVPGTTEIP